MASETEQFFRLVLRVEHDGTAIALGWTKEDMKQAIREQMGQSYGVRITVEECEEMPKDDDVADEMGADWLANHEAMEAWRAR